MIAIDEPELSLHPSIQSKLKGLITEYARDRQIVISTHAPKFIDWESISNGAQICRVVNVEGATKLYQLSEETKTLVGKLLNDMNNPHILGADANESFFLSDKIVLVEGQEDVLYFPKVLKDLGQSLDGEFFGWGAGGDSKLGTISQILAELGFVKVVGILDGNKKEGVPTLNGRFPEFYYDNHEADDIRYKKERSERTTLLDEKNAHIREKYRSSTQKMFERINQYLNTT